jgi:hypothetical protein
MSKRNKRQYVERGESAIFAAPPYGSRAIPSPLIPAKAGTQTRSPPVTYFEIRAC